MTNDMLAEAVCYVFRDGFSVIPMGQDKKPLIKWKEYQDRKPTFEEIVAWPDTCNLAIITGAISSIVVVDCESREDAEWFYRNRGKTPCVVQTRRGFHLYFRHPGQPVKNAQRVEDRYDVRGDGGYCFTAGHRLAVRPKQKQYSNSKSVPIENLKVGDKVLTYNEQTGEIESKPIIKTMNRLVDETVFIKFGTRQSVLQCTPEHPIYTTNGWKDAGNIVAGDELFHVGRASLSLGKGGHKFQRGVQSSTHKQGGLEYQRSYKQRIPSHIPGKKSGYEKFLESLAVADGLPISFTGDGSLIISHGELHLHPDFVVDGKKKVIEVHVPFHLTPKKTGEKQVLRNSTPSQRVAMYADAGWECLYLDATEWNAFDENTLSVVDDVRKRVREFSGNGKEVKFVQRAHGQVEVFNIEVEGNHNYFICGISGGKEDWYLAHNCMAPPSLHDEGAYAWKLPFMGHNLLPVFDMAWRPMHQTEESVERAISDGVAYISTIRAVAGQRGHDDTWRAANALKDSGLRECEALLCLLEWNKTHAIPSWSEKEILHKIKSAYGN